MNDAGDMQLLNSSWLLLLRLNLVKNGITAFRIGLGTSLPTSIPKRNLFRLGDPLLTLSIESESNMSLGKEEQQLFGKFRISTSQIFYRSKHSFAMVNLRPLVQGHVLVVSNRVVPLLSDLECEFMYFMTFMMQISYAINNNCF